MIPLRDDQPTFLDAVRQLFLDRPELGGLSVGAFGRDQAIGR
jgi:hypothetical protein